MNKKIDNNKPVQENGRSPINRTLPDYASTSNHSPSHSPSLPPSSYARYMGSGDSPTSSRPGSSRKRRPRRGDELFGTDKKHLRKSKEEEEQGEKSDWTVQL